MASVPLRLGRIAYLNVWPLYEALVPAFPESEAITYVPGHPAELNAALAAAYFYKDLAAKGQTKYIELNGEGSIDSIKETLLAQLA